MILRDRYDGGSSPLEGDRELVLRHLPSDARVIRARATVTPVDPGAGGDPFVETLAFQGNLGDWGATKSSSVPGGWVEVDFHARRTVVGLTGQLGGGAVQADFGGGFVPIGVQGTFLTPPQTALTVSGSAAVVPSLTATRVRLFGGPNQALDVTSVRVRSAPAGVRLGLRGRPALWFHAGELTRPETTPDFGAVLQAYLDEAGEEADGAWLLPFVLHSDALGRLAVELEIEYLRRTSVLPGGLQDAALTFGHGGLPKSGGELLASLPPNARVARTAGRVSGAFEATRVAFPEVLEEAAPLGALPVSPGSSPAHPVVLPKAIETVAVDFLLASVTRAARLQFDLRPDQGGKPAGESILSAPVPFTVDREIAGSATWISVPLAAPLQLRKDTKYWLVVQSLEGEAEWSVEAPKGALPVMQLTQDGGFSWRQAALPQGPVSGLFRLRVLPGRFTMPIELQVGDRRVSLSRFEAQGRVDFFLEFPEVATAFNEALASAAGLCPEVEHLVNGGFGEWTRTGSELGDVSRIPLQAEGHFDKARVVVTPDGGTAVVVASRDAREAVLWIVDLDREAIVADIRPISWGTVDALALDAGGARAWVGLGGPNGRRIWLVDLAGRRSLGEILIETSSETSGTQARRISALAPSLDGATLYAALAPFDDASQGGSVIALDVRGMEEAALRGEPNAESARNDRKDLSAVSPADLLVSPDGALLHVLVRTADQPFRADVLPVGTTPLSWDAGQGRDVGGSEPRALALTPDGRLVVALDDRVILETGEEISVPPEQAALALDPEGSHAFVAGEAGLTVVDLGRRTAAAPLDLGGPASDVAVAPGGDRVVAVIPSSARLVSIPVGPAVPAGWTVTAGRVRRWAGAALLGEVQEEGDRPEGKVLSVSSFTAALSQVVPVTAGCAYELAFEALATEQDAVAEVIWKTDACGTARTDSVPIRLLDERTAQTQGPPSLAVHRKRFQAPAGATQAEVRFRAPAGVAALVDDASFRGTAASVLAGELTGESLPEPWRISPPAAGLSVVPQAAGLRLRNAGARETVVSQEIELGEGRGFFLEIQGRSVAVVAGAPPARVEIRWLPADTVSSWELPAEGFGGLSARGAAPDGAVRAELRLAVPAGTALDVRSVDLRFPEPAEVPVTFVAQAPGDLTVLGWELLYDQVPPTRPPVPAGGLCAPASPPLAAGETGENGDCGCGAVPGSAVAPRFGRTAASAAARPVMDIPGIGKGRNRRLREAGMDSLQALAAASPDRLREVLPGTPRKVATGIILSARRRLREPR